MGNVQVRDIINESGDVNHKERMSVTEVNDLIDEWIPRYRNNKRGLRCFIKAGIIQWRRTKTPFGVIRYFDATTKQSCYLLMNH